MDVAIPKVPTVVFAQSEETAQSGDETAAVADVDVQAAAAGEEEEAAAPVTTSAAEVDGALAPSNGALAPTDAEQFADAEEIGMRLVRVGKTIPFGIGTMLNPDERLYMNDHVQFRVVVCEHNQPKAVALKKVGSS